MKKILLTTSILLMVPGIVSAALWGTGSSTVTQTDCSTITTGFCIDSDNGSLYYWDGDSVEQLGTSAGDNLGAATASDVSALYTGVSGYLFSDGTKKTPTASDVGAPTLATALVGDCTVGPCLDGSSDGGNMIKLWAGTGDKWTALQGGAPAANRSWRLPIDAPPSVGTTRLMNMDEYGQMGFVDPATFATPSGSAANMTVVATGFDGNLTTTDNTLQEIAQKLDDLVVGGGGYTNLTQFLTQTAWRLFYSDGSGDVKELALGSDGEYLKSNGASAAPSWATPTGGAHDAVTLGTDADAILGLSTQQITLDSQTANYFFAAPNGSSGDPTFRAIVAADIPTLNQNTTGTSAGLAGTPNITVGTISAASAAFSVDGTGKVTAKEFVTARTSSPSAIDFYESNTEPGDNKLTLTLSGPLTGDVTKYIDQMITTSSFDDTPDNGSTTTAPTSNWAYDHEADTSTHGVSSGAILGGALGSTDNQLLRSDGTGGATAQGTGITVDDSNNITVPGNISSKGSITGLMPSKVISSPSGTHDGSSNVATLSDSGESFTTNAYVGMTLYNITDGSSCTVTANNATTMTCTLAGGTDNDWDASDAWQVGPGPYQSGSWFYVTNAGTIRHPSTAGYQVCYESDAAAVLTIDMASSSMIFQGVLDSAVTALDAGDSIDSSGSTTGDFQCIHNKSATEAQGKGKRGTWADGGAT